jgi:uroporphyrinogen-III synthase
MADTRVLITRPRPQLDELATLLAESGLQPIAMPAFDFEATGESVAPDADWVAADTRMLVFTSPRAVAFGLNALAPGMLEDGHVASVGPATSRALAEHGLEPVQAAGPEFDSEALLRRIGREFTPGAAIILAAPGGRDAMRRGLEKLSWAVRVAPVYRRVLLTPAPAAEASIEQAGRVVSVWTSGTALEHFMASLSETSRERLRDGCAVVVSERLAKLARACGIADTMVADAPDNEALLACCRRAAS